MPEADNSATTKVALVTGGARRLGAAMVRAFHARGVDIALHYNTSRAAAESLATELNNRRAHSVRLFSADLCEHAVSASLVQQVVSWRNRLDVLVNNASSFYPTPLEDASEVEWNDLMASNLKAPFFITKAAAPTLRECKGVVLNMVDINAERPADEYPIYSAAKAGLVNLTKWFAAHLAPEVRVNGIAPGAIIWPEGEADATEREAYLASIPLHSIGEPEEIARAAVFLCEPDSYVTGQILAVDGGRSVTW